MDERELQVDDDSFAFAELDSQIRRMSLHADSILQSIQEVSGGAGSYVPRLSPRDQTADDDYSSGQGNHGYRYSAGTASRKPRDYLSYEDDDMTEEEERLESIAESIRESLAGSDMHVPKIHIATCSTSTDCEAPFVEKSEEVDQSSEILLLGCSIVWAMVIILFIHAQKFLLNEKGQIQFPFSS